MRHLALVCLLFAAISIAPAVQAQTDWPKGPVKVIVPFPPGGANDTVARPYADALSRSLGQPFIVENRGGAGGAVGMESLIRSKPDGYTLCMCASTVVSTVSNLRKVSYSANDVDVVAVTTMYISGLMLGPKNPATSFKEFIDYLKANPGKVVYGGSGVGSPTEFRMKYLANLTGTDMVSVPYSGNAPALNDLLSGVIDAIIELNGFPHVKAGKLRMIALYADERHPEFPDVPTIGELGFAQVNAPIWQGFYAPLGLPEGVRQKLNKAVNEISARPEMKTKLLTMGFATRTMSADESRKFFLDDDLLYKKIIQEAKISID
ncbi:MAG: tripartite tricarboxylate transporter substrate binding protein [Acetobacteraceae bacterium]|nr:tripartite tricarboxylate transporter substrate binding protein [Acetobacteraceae bacterium]